LIDHRLSEPPLWSPDGKQLAVAYIYFDGKISFTQDILVDIEKNLAAVFSNDKMILGWFNNP
jgi:Tol biopolymer transport system component